MSTKKTLIVNIIIWAELKEKANIIAAKLTRGKKNLAEDTFESIIQYPDPFKIKDYQIHLKAYTRWPESFSKSSPEPITEILIISISSPSSKYFCEALKYLNTRRGIPFKYVVSDYNLTKISKEIDCEFYTEKEILSENTLKKFLKNSFNIDYTLSKVFEKFDIDHNGYIEKFELLEISNELAYKLTSEEINEILNNLSRDRKIYYEQFKKWWVIGRRDFQSLRRIVDIQFTMNNFILETNSYLEKLRTEVELISTINLRHEGKILIASEEETLFPYPQREISATIPYTSENPNFDFTKINLKLVNGIEVDSMIETFPDYLRLNPFSFGIEFSLFDSNSGLEVIEVIKKLCTKIIEIPFLRETLNYFVQVNFRHVDMSVILDINLKSDLYLKHHIMKKLVDINLNQLMKKFIGTSNFYFIFGIKLFELFDIDFLHFLEKICKFKIDCHGEFSHIKHFTKIIWNIFESIFEKEFDSYWYNLHNIINLISNVTKLHLHMKYDHKSLFESLKEIISANFVRKFKLNEQVSSISKINNLGLLKAKEEFDNLRNYFLKFLDKFFNANYKSFIKNNISSLKKINFDKVELYFLWPKIKLYMKCGLMSDGITKYINNKYL